MTKYTTIKGCRLCDSSRLIEIMDFGQVPLANDYPATTDATQDIYPISLVFCEACHHVQIPQTVSPEILFGDYLYSSSDSPPLVAEMREFAGTLANKLRLRPEDGILEIGCNDGILLREFAKNFFENLHGVDPATNLSLKARESGANIIPRFFSDSLARDVRDQYGRMKLICATNAFAHIADLREVMRGIDALLDEDGVCVFENAYVMDMLGKCLFDAIYHEHLNYYGVWPLARFFNSFGFEIFDVQRVPAQGGSIRVFVKRCRSDRFLIEPIVADLIQQESTIDPVAEWTGFRMRLITMVQMMKHRQTEWAKLSMSMSCYGCPAKFAMVSHLLGWDPFIISFVVDDSPMKQGRFTPGAKIPIVSNQYFREHQTDGCIITAWNVADAIMHRNRWYRGKWVVVKA